MKKLISIILCVILVASTFAACSFNKPSFVKIDKEICVNDNTQQHMCIKDNLLFIVSDKIYYDYDAIEENEDCEVEYEKVDNRFTLYDIIKDEIIAQKDFETKEPLDIFNVEFDGDDKVVVYGDEKLTYYDYSFNEVKVKKFDEKADWPYALGKSDFGDDINCTLMGVYQGFSNNFESMIFKSEPDSVYITDKCEDREFVIAGDKRLISQKSVFSDDRSLMLSTTLKVFDFESKAILNSYTFDFEPEDKISFCQFDGALNDEIAVISATINIADDDGSIDSKTDFYVWRYNENSEPEGFKADKYNYNDINDMSKKLAKDISEKYSIFVDFNVDTVPDYDEELTEEDKFYTDFKITDIIALYDSMLDIDEVLSNFPEGMVARLGKFELYVVNSITGCGAYASTTTDAFTDEITYYVVTCYNDIYDLPHELMHCFDDYISNNSDDEPLILPYMELNPVNIFDESFYNEHDEDDKTDYVYNGNNKDTAAFVTEYATTSVGEDKAELFLLLYNLGTKYDDYKDNGMEKLSVPAIRKKAELICKTLREYFPEITDTPVWETALNK